MKISTLIKYCILISVISIGTYIRFIDLDTHFVHNDDGCVAWCILNAMQDKDYSYYKTKLSDKENDPRPIVQAIRKLEQNGILKPVIDIENKLHLSKYFAEPLAFSSPPLQYILTSNLINPNQSYREILFWGRFPSLLFGILGLIALILFYISFKEKGFFPYLLTSLTLITFSWENIIFSKQMQAYSFGVLCAILLIWLLVYNLKNPDFSLKRQLLNGFTLALFAYAQYQLLIFIPAFYITLFYFYWNNLHRKSNLIKSYLLGIILFFILIAPLYFIFLIDKVGITYNAGPNNEYLFSLSNFSPLFFIKNSFLVFYSNLAFMSQLEPLQKYLISLFMLFFFIGVFSFIKTKNPIKALTGTYFFIIGVLWIALIVSGKIALSPSRHNLILLPYQAIIISEGVGFVFSYIKNHNIKNLLHQILSVVIFLVILFSFFLNFNLVIKSRSDIFNEKEIFNILKKYDVKTLVSYRSTYNIALMLFSKKDSPINHFQLDYWQNINKELNYNKIAFVSQTYKLNKNIFEEVKNLMNRHYKTPKPFTHNFNDYKVLYSKEINTNVEQDFLPFFGNLTNGLHFYVLEKR